MFKTNALLLEIKLNEVIGLYFDIFSYMKQNLLVKVNQLWEVVFL